MFYILPLVSSVMFLISLIPTFLINQFQQVQFPTIAEEKPSIDSIKLGFGKIFREELSQGTTLSDIKVLAIASGQAKLALVSTGKEIKTVKLGEKLGDFEIVDIKRNSIVLARGSERRTLSYPIESASPSGKISQITRTEFSKREIEKLTNDPGMLFQEIRLRPVIEDGKTKGFAFDWIKQGSIFERAGIKQGDILLSINNIEIKSGEDAFRILQALRNEPSLKVTLLRGGQNIDINLRFD